MVALTVGLEEAVSWEGGAGCGLGEGAGYGLGG